MGPRNSGFTIAGLNKATFYSSVASRRKFVLKELLAVVNVADALFHGSIRLSHVRIAWINKFASVAEHGRS